ncbi:unnamed protein product [Cladocopium goreaui]|uniref:Uncharacterized protein n=1 Tax=Cladocopium goreaui TaxID=2562237 RepID=A0A9P1GPE1_9DINO|nr:unnamed protein product [Cladocopium goreaui]
MVDKFSGSFVSLVRHCYGWCRGRQPCRNSAMVSPERHSEDSFSEDSLSSDGTDLSEDLHDLPQSERHLNSASASAGPVDDVSFQQDGRPKYIEDDGGLPMDSLNEGQKPEECSLSEMEPLLDISKGRQASPATVASWLSDEQAHPLARASACVYESCHEAAMLQPWCNVGTACHTWRGQTMDSMAWA